MKRARLAVIGYGKLGQKCAEEILASEDLALAGIVRRPETVAKPLAPGLKNIPTATHVRDLGEIAAALICVPAEHSLGTILGLLQSGIPAVECARFAGEAFRRHQAEIHRAALHHKLPAVVGAGWEPGALSLFRCLFDLLAPHGSTEIARHSAASLHHTLAATRAEGVRKALATEFKTKEGVTRRYVYAELKPGANAAAVEQDIRSDPLFLDEETEVFVVDNLAELEEEGRGVVMERRAAAGGSKRLLLETRFDEERLAARMMLGAARALPACKPGAHSLPDLPIAALWGDLRPKAEKDWF